MLIETFIAMLNQRFYTDMGTWTGPILPGVLEAISTAHVNYLLQHPAGAPWPLGASRLACCKWKVKKSPMEPMKSNELLLVTVMEKLWMRNLRILAKNHSWTEPSRSPAHKSPVSPEEGGESVKTPQWSSSRSSPTQDGGFSLWHLYLRTKGCMSHWKCQKLCFPSFKKHMST